MRRVGLYMSMLGALTLVAGVVKGLLSLLGVSLNLPPGNPWVYFLLGIAIFWIGAFIFSPREQRESDARAIYSSAHRWWNRCAKCGAGLDEGQMFHPSGGRLVLASTAYLCNRCGAATCRDCFNEIGKCSQCGASDIVKDIEVVAAWKQIRNHDAHNA